MRGGREKINMNENGQKMERVGKERRVEECEGERFPYPP